jgi:uncharacterized protein (DUF427 family)
MSHLVNSQYWYRIGEKLIIGDASYYNFKDADGKEYKDIAWYVLLPHFLAELRWSWCIRYYPTPMKGAEKVAGRVAFNVRKYSELKVGEPAREELEDKSFKLGDMP